MHVKMLLESVVAASARMQVVQSLLYRSKCGMGCAHSYNHVFEQIMGTAGENLRMPLLGEN